MTDYFSQSKIASTTKKSYNKTLSKWLELFNTKITPTYIYNNPYESVTLLRKSLISTDSDSQSILNRYIIAIMAYRKYNLSSVTTDPVIYSQWNLLLKHTYSQIIQYRENSEPTFLQQQKSGYDMTLKEIEDIRDDLPTSLTKLLIAFYTMIPPMRADYGMVQISHYGEQPSTANFIYMDNKRATMFIRDFKTAKDYYEIKTDLPKPLYKLLKESLQQDQRDYLFVNRFGSPFNRSNFSSWANENLSRVFSKDFSLTLFRHIFISNLDFSKMKLSEREAIAKAMGHSLNQQLQYHWISND
jgi:hypothetical protein